MGVLAGVIKDAISNVGLFNGNAFITGTFTGESCDSNGVWVWGLHTTTIVIPGQSLTFSAYGHTPQTQTIPSPGSDGNIWMTAALQREVPPATSCFTEEVLVIMENGSEKPISEIRKGDYVLGKDGAINQVIGIENPELGSRLLYSLNGSKPFVTAEHPFYGESGWCSLDPLATEYENNLLKVKRLILGNRVIKFSSVEIEAHRRQEDIVLIASAKKVVTSLETIEKITPVKADPTTRLFNLLLDGNNTYYANGYLVHNKGDH